MLRLFSLYWHNDVKSNNLHEKSFHGVPSSIQPPTSKWGGCEGSTQGPFAIVTGELSTIWQGQPPFGQLHLASGSFLINFKGL